MPRSALLRSWLDKLFASQYPDKDFLVEPASALFFSSTPLLPSGRWVDRS